MESKNFEFEEFLIVESIGLSFHGFDFVVGPFEWTGGDRIVVPSENALGSSFERLLRQTFHYERVRTCRFFLE